MSSSPLSSPYTSATECLTHLHQRLHDALDGMVPSMELLFVDDRSPDGSWETLQPLAGPTHVRQVVRLSRNFGQHAAITAGLEHSQGALDRRHGLRPAGSSRGDPTPLQNALEGYDVVLGRRRARHEGA